MNDEVSEDGLALPKSGIVRRRRVGEEVVLEEGEVEVGPCEGGERVELVEAGKEGRLSIREECLKVWCYLGSGDNSLRCKGDAWRVSAISAVLLKLHRLVIGTSTLISISISQHGDLAEVALFEFVRWQVANNISIDRRTY